MAAKPAALNDAPSPLLLDWKIEAAMGTNAPVATRPLILCSMLSATSKGFFSAAGRTTPPESFTKHALTSNKAGTQNHGLANHGSRAFCSGVLA